MSHDITIPAAALEAGRAAYERSWENGGDPDDWFRAAFLAMLAAWPGMECERTAKGYEWPLTEEYTDVIILPLPQEASDDQ